MKEAAAAMIYPEPLNWGGSGWRLVRIVPNFGMNIVLRFIPSLDIRHVINFTLRVDIESQTLREHLVTSIRLKFVKKPKNQE